MLARLSHCSVAFLRMFAEIGGPSSSGARGVHALEGAETAEEWWGYNQEG